MGQFTRPGTQNLFAAFFKTLFAQFMESLPGSSASGVLAFFKHAMNQIHGILEEYSE
jgi:hypothetical protein